MYRNPHKKQGKNPLKIQENAKENEDKKGGRPMSNLNAGDLSAIWQIMLKTMQSENLISSTACDLWFKCFRLDYLDPDKAVFAVENEMKRNIILDK